MTENLLPEPCCVLPHRQSMLLLKSVFESGDKVLLGIGSVPPNSKVARNGVVPGLLAVEMAAQAAAYHGSLSRLQEGGEPDKKGYLVRLRSVSLNTATLDVDGDFEVRVEQEGSAAGLAVYAFSVGGSQEVLVEGALSIFRAV